GGGWVVARGKSRPARATHGVQHEVVLEGGAVGSQEALEVGHGRMRVEPLVVGEDEDDARPVRARPGEGRGLHRATGPDQGNEDEGGEEPRDPHQPLSVPTGGSNGARTAWKAPPSSGFAPPLSPGGGAGSPPGPPSW